MRKRVNKFAAAVWFLACLIAVGDFVYFFAFKRISLLFPTPNNPFEFYEWIANMWLALRTPIFTVAQLVALGAIIEILDHVRKAITTPPSGDPASSI